MKRVAIIGHRGVGKSHFLTRVEGYYREAGREVSCIDLDREVEKRAGKGISAVFLEHGEVEFRRIELETFRAIDEETKALPHDVYLATGAGFDPGQIPATWRALWLRRETDPRGRIFIDRPRLNARVPAIEEFNERFHRRQAAYRERADQTLIMDEGQESFDAVERDFILGDLKNIGGALTVTSENFRRGIEAWLNDHVRLGVQWFELRDDLLSHEQMEEAARILPDDRILISFRNGERRLQTEALIERSGLAFDWPAEMGACEFAEPRFISTHRRDESESLTQALTRLPSDVPVKAALPVRDFEELAEAEEWRASAPELRSFLPMSKDGRWSWYRLLRASQQALGFFREGDGSGADQPTLLQWARRSRVRSEEFAAVLGDPVVHSRTPIEQRDFFAARGASVFAIRVTEDEWTLGALERLQELGLRAAAVTSPLKPQAFASSEPDELSRSLKATNTLKWMRDHWEGTNTDLEGFRKLVAASSPLGQVAVWGGGGTLAVIRAVLPDAEFYSQRTGEIREGRASAEPDTVIWAVGSSRAGAQKPPPAWQPRQVIDLNYGEDSPGRAFALELGAKYISGLAMFRAQAEAQRRFWENLLVKK